MSCSVLSIRTICDIAGVTRSQLFREIASGRLKAHKVGARTIIKTNDFVDWLNSNDSPKHVRQLCGAQFESEPRLDQILSADAVHQNRRLAYSIAEFASLTSLSTDSIRREIKSGRLKGVKVGKDRILIPASEGEAWVQSLQSVKVG